nr:MAG TPA: hypothetical protein [Caudoviricetes sp.]
MPHLARLKSASPEQASPKSGVQRINQPRAGANASALFV